jgi:hypothetical protein
LEIDEGTPISPGRGSTTTYHSRCWNAKRGYDNCAKTEEEKTALAKQKENQPDVYKANCAALAVPDGQRRGPMQRAMSRVFIEEAVTFFSVRRIQGRRLLGKSRYIKWFKDKHDYTEDKANEKWEQDLQDKDIIKEWEDGEQKMFVKEDTRLESASGVEKRKRVVEQEDVASGGAESVVQAKFRMTSDPSDAFSHASGGQVFRSGASSSIVPALGDGIGCAPSGSAGSGAWDQLFGRGVAPQAQRSEMQMSGNSGGPSVALGGVAAGAAGLGDSASGSAEAAGGTPNKLTPVQFVSVKRERVTELTRMLEQVVGLKGSFARLQKVNEDVTGDQSVKDEVQLAEHIASYKIIFDKFKSKIDELKKSTLKSWESSLEGLDDLVVQVAEGTAESDQIMKVFADVEQQAKKDSEKARQKETYKLRKTAGLLTTGNFPPEFAKHMAKYTQTPAFGGETEDIKVDPKIEEVDLCQDILKFTASVENQGLKLIVAHLVQMSKPRVSLSIAPTGLSLT